MAKQGDNSVTEQEQYEEQQFLKGFSELKALNSDKGGLMGEYNQLYKRMKDVGNFSKADFKWALELEEKDASEILATMQRRIRIAQWMGHGLARQLEMFDTDRTPVEDLAAIKGLAAGKKGDPNSNPYDPGSKPGQRWQEAFNEGHAFRNKEIHIAVNGADGAIPEMEEA
jgi:hypothetical protein